MRAAQTRVITGMVLPTGWHYLQPFKDSKTRIISGSYEELLDQVQIFRSNNGLPVGNVQADVDNYICAAYPRSCRTVKQAQSSVRVSVPSAQQTRFIDKLVQWALGMQRSGTTLVFIPEAESRGLKCAQCPHNVMWQTSGCGRCESDAQRLFLLVRQGKDTSLRSKLHGCNLHNHDNRTAIWLQSKASRSAQAPQNCWV